MKRIVVLFAALLAYAGLALAAININSATQEQLEKLDGIGPVKAQAIIEYRQKNGPFRKLEDIKNVPGVGDATYQKIRKDIALSGRSTDVKDEKAEPKKADTKKADAKKAEEKKADTKKADEKKADTKTDTKKTDAKKTEEKKADEKKK